MKKLLLSSLLLSSVLTLAVTGCKLVGSNPSPPSAWEQRMFDISTNFAARVVTTTNVVPIYQTNIAVVPYFITNSIGVPVEVMQTNYVPQTIYLTNTVTQTNLVETYTYNGPSTAAKGTAGAAGALSNIGAPGIGSLVTMGILGALAIWGHLRSTKKAGEADALSQTASTLTQIIEVGQELMNKTPQGAQMAQAWKDWMVKHQAEQGVIDQVMAILPEAVNNDAAKGAADKLVAMMGGVAALTPTPPPTPPPAPPGPAVIQPRV